MIWDLINSYRQAFRMYLRTKTRPKTIAEAEEKRLFWSKMYLASAFLSMTYCTYLTAKKGITFNYRKDIPKERAIAEKMTPGAKTITVYEGFKRVGEIDLTKPAEIDVIKPEVDLTKQVEKSTNS